MPPQLRPRKHVKDYTVRGASGHPPSKRRTTKSKPKTSKPRQETSPPPADVLRKIWDQLVNNGDGDILQEYKIQTLKDGTVVRVHPGSRLVEIFLIYHFALLLTSMRSHL